MQSHCSSLRDEVVPHLIPADEIEWEEQKHLSTVSNCQKPHTTKTHLAALQTPLNISNIRIRVSLLAGNRVLFTPTVLSQHKWTSILKSLFFNGDAGRAACVEDGRTHGWDLDVSIPTR